MKNTTGVKVTYVAETYDRLKRSGCKMQHYIKWSPFNNLFYWIEVDPVTRYDIRQGLIAENLVDPETARKAKSESDIYPSYVEWQGIGEHEPA